MSKEQALPDSVKKLDTNRREVRYRGKAEPQIRERSSSLHEVSYPDKVVSSVYFNSRTNTPERGSVRFRFRSDERPEHEVYVFDPTQKGTFEIKLRPQQTDGDGEKTRKYSVEDVSLDEIIEAVRDPKNFGNLDKYPQGDHIRRMIQILFQGNGIDPLLMIQTERRHFIHGEQSVRMTLDQGTSYWLMNSDNQRRFRYARRAETMEDNLLELKTSQEADPDDSLLEQLFGEANDYQLGDRIKRSYGVRLYQKFGQPERVNPEDTETEEDRTFVEKEAKIDVSADPRIAITELTSNAADITLAPEVPSEMYFRFLKLENDMTIGKKSYDESFELSAYQYKEPISDGEILERTEQTAYSLTDLLKKLSVNEQTAILETTTFAKRTRLERSAVCEDTGNHFVILADHCTANDERNPLNQIEVEYLGNLDFPSDPQSQVDAEQIERDFRRIKQVVLAGLKGSDIAILPTQTTKEAWISKEN